jgi:hypothetical protein
MSQHTCLKCGGQEFDRGINYLAIGAGIALVLVGTLLMFSVAFDLLVAKWATYTSARPEDFPAMVALCSGIFISIEGGRTWDRLRCRTCGTLMTPHHHITK